MLSPTASAHRADLAELARLAESDLSVLFRNVAKADHVRQGLMDTLPQLVDVYGSAAASLGADWYDGLREEAAVKGKFRAIVADLPDVGRTDALAGWSVGPLFGANPDASAALSMASGGLQRIIFNADRDTVAQSSIQDRSARGWQREGGGECSFCQMLIGRGAVYSEATANFDSHDRCKCVGVPVFGSGGSSNGSRAGSPRAKSETVSAFAPGAQTVQRAASIETQLATFEKVLANGGGTDWMRDQVKKLRKEQAAFKGR